MAVVIYAIKELTLFDVSKRRGLYNALKKLLGIKGYYTNLEESLINNKTVIG